VGVVGCGTGLNQFQRQCGDIWEGGEASKMEPEKLNWPIGHKSTLEVLAPIKLLRVLHWLSLIPVGLTAAIYHVTLVQGQRADVTELD